MPISGNSKRSSERRHTCDQTRTNLTSPAPYPRETHGRHVHHRTARRQVLAISTHSLSDQSETAGLPHMKSSASSLCHSSQTLMQRNCCRLEIATRSAGRVAISTEARARPADDLSERLDRHALAKTEVGDGGVRFASRPVMRAHERFPTSSVSVSRVPFNRAYFRTEMPSPAPRHVVPQGHQAAGSRSPARGPSNG